ncbi:hypothetical protein OPS25_01325 [Alteromonas ponticola]|uniref:Uncharacterized protein n=1 Tax=Alteromonas aquimaris TaxID=2998417 RepID=A0ABT3P319_9ALTE|nr:hypothetical protein [Alteromonas aquimaris]MCW8107143.1 hypothetical protein [Alteromonas aquimaris]
MPRTESLKHQNSFNYCLKCMTKKSGINQAYVKKAFSRRIFSKYGQSVASGSASTHALRMEGKRYKKEREEFYQEIKKLKEQSRHSNYIKHSSLPLIGCQNARLKVAPSEGAGDWWREQE